MGVYLNSKAPYGLFAEEAAAMYFVDKSEMLLELLPLVESRMASMIASFFGKGKDSSRLFAQLKFQGRLGEPSKCTGRILAVGISYNRKTKKHTCMVEVL